MNKCCKNCEVRTFDCHHKCNKYAQFRKGIELIKNSRKKESEIVGYTYSAKMRMKKSRRKIHNE